MVPAVLMTSKIQDHVAQIFCGLMYVWKEEKGFLKGKKKKKKDTGGRRMQKAFIALNSTRGIRQDTGKF